MWASSQRRPKSDVAAAAARRRTHTPDVKPWDDSLHVNQRRTPSARRTATAMPSSNSNRRNNSVGCRLYEGAGASVPQTPERSSYSTLTSTPASALPPSAVPSACGLQFELMSQLQDIVVRLSQSAAGENQRLSHMQQRLDAYAVLMREQDHMINELRGMNVKLQKENDTLIAFRQQSLHHDFHVMNTLENDDGIDEELGRAFVQHEGRKSSSGTSFNNSYGTMNPQVRSFVRSLVAQLRYERRKRLEVEEQSSQMIGEQQLTIQRLEHRLRPQTTSLTQGRVFTRVEGVHASCKDGISVHVPDPKDRDQHFSMGNGSSCPSTVVPTNLVITTPEDATAVSLNPVSASTSTPAAVHGPNKDEMAEKATLTASRVPPNVFPSSGRGVRPFKAPVVLCGRGDARQEEPTPVVPVAMHGTIYEDAASILSNIRKRHGL